MHKSYRTFSLQALRTGPIEIAEKISEHKSLIETSQNQIEKSILKYVSIWSVGLCLTISTICVLIYGSLLSGFILFFFLCCTSLPLSKLPIIHRQLVAQKRYDEQNKQIKKSLQAIEELHSNARAYQCRLECTTGPGYLATLQDVILHPHYPSFFTHEDREKFVRLSSKGRGQEIDIYEYGRIVLEIKSTNIVDYIDTTSLVEKILPQNKYTAALEFARLIALNYTTDKKMEMQLIATVGLNAWLACQEQGRPATVDHDENDEWDFAKKIFQYTLDNNQTALDEILTEHNLIQIKRLKKRN